MTFPLGSLHSDAAGAGKGADRRVEPAGSTARATGRLHRVPKAPAVASVAPVEQTLRYQATLLLGGVLWILVVLAMISHDRMDPAFTTSGQHAVPHNWVGQFGAYVADLLQMLLGHSAWWLPLVTLRWWLGGLARWMRRDTARSPARVPVALQSEPSSPWTWRFWLGLALLLAASCALEWSRLYRNELMLAGEQAGGVLGLALGQWGMRWLGFNGSGVLWIALLVAGSALALRFSWLDLAERIGQLFDRLRQQRETQREVAQDIRIGEKAAIERERVVEEVRQEAPIEPIPLIIEQPMIDVPKSDRVTKEKQKPLFAEMADGKLPQIDLLDAAPGRTETITTESLEMTSRLIEKKLKDFGVEVRVVAASPGPVITRYEIEPATGVKGSQIVNLAKDLARSLSLVSIRVVETIPGKNLMALELPNAKRQMIRLTEILGSQVYHEAQSMLTIGLGKDIVGSPVVADLAKMPHCLVAGTTGSGKSVGINATILSLLYKAEARDVRLILIDPKMLEMSMYEGIPHLLCPVVTDMKQAANALNWAVGEMERRYKLMSKMGVRNLAGFNKKMDEARARGELIPNPFSLTPDEPEPLDRMPHIVIVIDELADLMMVVGKKIEELIARLAQKARAAGVHLILATQRPSVDVITGLIKANIPTRISFQVSSKIDSRTILDQMGAEALLGQGDMLYLPSGSGLPIRVHGAFVSDEEVHRVVQYIKSQGEPNYIEGILEGGNLSDEGSNLDGSPMGGSDGEQDPMYDNAVAVVLQHKKASISLVQRHLRIGYNRAARLLEQMEKSGLVSSMATNGNRELIVPARGGEGGATSAPWDEA
ncbi:MAG: DNA translocase FtsK 4TM domain-containing protein [Aquabacterium sp.]|jgi:S-DNA-T family DNA segregation ATPase FtsK/SpoIIIE|uniref:DNA translocase FtsK n=1 Tax=Aquabacterium sp. TaxID=1872578 RepID=UPI001B58015A|nr:DNA translocase FtsK [Aquabacterium sp.]MBP7132890.1 DNA translocase FtsK 4TM domain-containing protein [Aquabacterium sp.]